MLVTLPAAPMQLESPRAMFHMPPDITYLNCANLAPRLHAVREAGRRAAERMAEPWRVTPAEWFSGAERLRGLFAGIVNADAEGVALVPSASYGIAVAAANVAVERGQQLVVLDREFPSNVYAWRDLARRREARLHTVQRTGEQSWTDAVVGSIGPATAVVAVPHCHWTDGTIVDLVEVGRRARAVGAALVVDGSQSVGALPLDVAAVQPDFLVTVGYKWLLGPYGIAYLYVAPSRRSEGTPLERSWLAREGAEDFASLTAYRDSYRPGARRFDMGGFPMFDLMPMAVAALEQVLAWGVLSIQRSLTPLTRQFVEDVSGLGGCAPPSTACAGHLVGVRCPGGFPRSLIDALAASRVYVSVRGDCLRVAPHLHNDLADMARLLAALRRGFNAA